MNGDWERQMDIYGPLERAGRCLDIWLKEEGRQLEPLQRQRAAALMARYFHYEDEVTDELMLSFLRHYSGRREVDMEDPTSVRMELKSVLDAASSAARPSRALHIMAVTLGLCLLLTLSGAGWALAHAKITPAQQAQLKELVAKVAEHEKAKGTSTAAVWAQVKHPLHLRRYQDMSWWDYRGVKKDLQARLEK
ncbi:MAG: hypothetical protein GC185_08735 [Alphaproteobacteria bacterium]|nr:hypothetical protein [Alphaproteobacteria bacterium]